MKTKLGKYLTLEGSFEDQLRYFDEKIKELNQLEKEAEVDGDHIFASSYKNLAFAFRIQRNKVASQIGQKK